MHKLTFHYLKSHTYRVHHVDGVIGGLTPKGYMHMAVFSERAPIPQAETHELSQEGIPTGNVETESKQGIIREIECDLMMDISTARALRDWLDRQLTAIDTHINKSPK